jgi:hypothetical protein
MVLPGEFLPRSFVLVFHRILELKRGAFLCSPFFVRKGLAWLPPLTYELWEGSYAKTYPTEIYGRFLQQLTQFH